MKFVKKIISIILIFILVVLLIINIPKKSFKNYNFNTENEINTFLKEAITIKHPDPLFNNITISNNSKYYINGGNFLIVDKNRQTIAKTAKNIYLRPFTQARVKIDIEIGAADKLFSSKFLEVNDYTQKLSDWTDNFTLEPLNNIIYASDISIHYHKRDYRNKIFYFTIKNKLDRSFSINLNSFSIDGIFPTSEQHSQSINFDVNSLINLKPHEKLNLEVSDDKFLFIYKIFFSGVNLDSLEI